MKSIPGFYLRAKKAIRRDSLDMLRREGVGFTTSNRGVHCIVEHNGLTVDFWPAPSGRFKVRDTSREGLGITALLALLKGGEA